MIITNQKIIDSIEGGEEIIKKHNMQPQEVSEGEQLAFASLSQVFPYSQELRSFIYAAWGYFLACATSGRGQEIRATAALMTLTTLQINLHTPKPEDEDENLTPSAP